MLNLKPVFFMNLHGSKIFKPSDRPGPMKRCASFKVDIVSGRLVVGRQVPICVVRETYFYLKSSDYLALRPTLS